MTNKTDYWVKEFMSNLLIVNELHHPNDYCRLYNIALCAVRNGESIPYDMMKEVFYETIEQQNLNRENFESYYDKYIKVLEIVYDILNRINSKIPLNSITHF